MTTQKIVFRCDLRSYSRIAESEKERGFATQKVLGHVRGAWNNCCGSSDAVDNLESMTKG